MTSFIHVSQLTPSDLAQLGNNIRPPRTSRRLDDYCPVRQSLSLHEPGFTPDTDDEPADIDEQFELAITSKPELSDALK